MNSSSSCNCNCECKNNVFRFKSVSSSPISPCSCCSPGPRGPQGEPGPPFLLNPPTPCQCSSTFTINQEVTLNFALPTPDSTGNLSLNGSICPNCNNAGSRFTLVFVDSDPSDGDQSFSFIPLSIQPEDCRIDFIEGVEYLVQQSLAVGLYIPANGASVIGIVTLFLFESTTPGQDDAYQFQITDTDPFNEFIVGSNALLVPTPDTTVFVTDCP